MACLWRTVVSMSIAVGKWNQERVTDLVCD